MDIIKYQIPNDAKYFSTVRLITSGILNLLNRDIEEIEDLKMAVTETLNIAHDLKTKEIIDLVFEIEDSKIKIYVEEIDNEKLESCEELSLAKTVINCLVDNCESIENKLILTKEY